MCDSECDGPDSIYEDHTELGVIIFLRCRLTDFLAMKGCYVRIEAESRSETGDSEENIRGFFTLVPIANPGESTYTNSPETLFGLSGCIGPNPQQVGFPEAWLKVDA